MPVEIRNEMEAALNDRLTAAPQDVLFAQTPKGITIGVVSDSKPSPLALLATGIAGIAARRALRGVVSQTPEAASVASKQTDKKE